MNLEEMVDHYRAEVKRTAEECAARLESRTDCSRQNYMIGAYSSIVRELLSEMDEATRQRLAARLKAWRDYEEEAA